MFRIQKLLLQEYRDIYEPVMVENPFTQITACGEGLRQFHIGLTRSKIVFACDDFDFVDVEDFSYKGIDPEIETLELVSLMPLQFLQFDFFYTKGRHIMSVSIFGEEDRPMLFEFGGHSYKSLFWKIWRERVATIKYLQNELLCISAESSLHSNDNILATEERYNVQGLADSYNSQLTWRSYATNCSLMSH